MVRGMPMSAHNTPSLRGLSGALVNMRLSQQNALHTAPPQHDVRVPPQSTQLSTNSAPNHTTTETVANHPSNDSGNVNQIHRVDSSMDIAADTLQSSSSSDHTDHNDMSASPSAGDQNVNALQALDAQSDDEERSSSNNDTTGGSAQGVAVKQVRQGC